MDIYKLRIVTLATVRLLEIVLFGGLHLGWVSIVFTLKQDKVFEDLCDGYSNNVSRNASGDTASGNVGCFPQDERFNLIFSIGIAVLAVMTTIHGQLYFKFGVRTVRIFTILVTFRYQFCKNDCPSALWCEMVVGLLCIGFTSTDNPWLPIPGLIFIGVSGLSLLLCNIKVAVLLRTWSSVYIGLMNGCFDSSIVTVMIVKVLYNNGFKRLNSYVGATILFLLISGLGTILHTNSSKSANETKAENYTAESVSTDQNDLTSKDKREACELQDIPGTDMRRFGSRSRLICSRLFISHVIWFSIVQLRYLYFMGSANRLFGQVVGNDTAEVSYFTDVMTYTMLGGILSSFFSGYVLEVQKKWFSGSMKTAIPMSMTSCLAVLLSCLNLVSTRTALYADFFILTTLRSFIFSTNMVFCLSSFPSKLSGFLVAVAFSVSGIITLLQYALFTWTDQYDNATTHVNVLLLVLSIISLFHPLMIIVEHRRGSHKLQKQEIHLKRQHTF